MTFNSFQNLLGATGHMCSASSVCNATVEDDSLAILDRMKMAVQAREERFQELKRQFVAAREVVRSLGGDVSTDNPYFKNI